MSPPVLAIYHVPLTRLWRGAECTMQRGAHTSAADGSRLVGAALEPQARQPGASASSIVPRGVRSPWDCRHPCCCSPSSAAGGAAGETAGARVGETEVECGPTEARTLLYWLRIAVQYVYVYWYWCRVLVRSCRGSSKPRARQSRTTLTP